MKINKSIEKQIHDQSIPIQIQSIMSLLTIVSPPSGVGCYGSVVEAWREGGRVYQTGRGF